MVLGGAALLLMLVPVSTVNNVKAATYALTAPLLASRIPQEELAAAEDLNRPPGKVEKTVLLQFDAKLTAKEDELRRMKAQVEEIGAARESGIPAEAMNGSVPAQVIGRRMLWGEEYIAVDKGSDDGVEVGAGVLHAGTIVGRVAGVSRKAAVIAFITHRTVQVPVKLLKGRGNGMLSGCRNGGVPSCRMEFVRDRTEVTEGDQVVSSGLDGTFPAGLPVGRVAECRLPEGARFWEIVVEPKVSLDDLETVLILRPDAARLPWPAARKGSRGASR
jgi:rod shape-determining protein MreC